MKRVGIRLQQWLGSFPVISWGVLYLVVIIAFAAIYSFTSSGFYHSTSQFEKSLDNDEAEISKELSMLINSYVNDAGIYNGWAISRDHLYVYGLDTKEGKFEFVINTLFEKEGSKTGMSLKVYYVLNERMLECDLKDEDSCFTYKFLQTTRPLFDKTNKFMTLIEPTLAFFGEISQLKMPLSLDSKITSYVDAKKGFPSEASGGFGRMLYFSVVTITTLGYGDIVPTTSINRFLVGFESILGLVIVGLFLNSLAYVRNV